MDKYSYQYEDIDNIYCYKGTNILKNRLNIKDAKQLKKVERHFSITRSYSLQKKKLPGNFSLKTLQYIHKELFQDVYEWAGEIRKVDIAKGTIFCLVPFIETQFQEFYSWLQRRNFLQNETDKNTFVKDVAYVLGEINMIHPFREGNGRTQRLYVEKLVELNGRFEICFDRASAEEMIIASAKASVCDYKPMEQLIDKCLFIKKA